MPDAPSPFHANPRRAPDDVWARVREDYLSGLPATVVCQRHGVGLTHVAMRRMMRAVLRGQAAEALRWRRVRLVLEAEAAIEARLAEQEQRLWDYHYGPAATSPDPDTGHGAGQGAGHLD